MWQLQTTEHTNQDNNQSILIKEGETSTDMPPPDLTPARQPSIQGLYYCSYPMASLSRGRS